MVSFESEKGYWSRNWAIQVWIYILPSEILYLYMISLGLFNYFLLHVSSTLCIVFFYPCILLNYTGQMLIVLFVVYTCIYNGFVGRLMIEMLVLVYTEFILVWLWRQLFAYRNSLESVPGTNQYWAMCVKFLAQGNNGLSLIEFEPMWLVILILIVWCINHLTTPPLNVSFVF